MLSMNVSTTETTQAISKYVVSENISKALIYRMSQSAVALSKHYVFSSALKCL